MPRRASHLPSSTTTTSKKHSTPTSITRTPSSRLSARLKSSPLCANGSTTKNTPKKSQYFPAAEDSTSEASSSFDNEASGYEDEDPSASAISSPPASATSSPSPDPSSEDERPKKRKRGTSGKEKANKKVAVKVNEERAVVGEKGQELWRPGVKSKLAPGEAVFVALPKARGDGGVRYVDERVHPNTMVFLGELRENNDREWLKVHDADYRASKRDWDTFVESLTPLIAEKDETIPELPPKDLTFRIYRDIRFSSDPTPYKPHFSAAWSRTGRKGPYAGYYLQIAPHGRSFLGAGLWHPEAAPLALLRRDIDRHPERIKAALQSEGIVREFFGLGEGEKEGKKGGKKEGKGKGKAKAQGIDECIKKFVAMNAENALKTKPRDYDADHRDIALLRLRNFTIGRKLKDEEVVGEGGLKRVVDLLECLVPFVTYLNSVVMPDDPPASASSDTEQDGAEDNVEQNSGSESDIEDEV